MKIHIFGASGSGVTTLGKSLADKLQCPYFDSDDYFWMNSDPPYTVRRNVEERNEMIEAALAVQPDWVFGGSIINWGDHWITVFDLVVFLQIPHAVRMERLRTREFERYGDVIYTDPRRRELFNQFIEWAAGYDDTDTTRAGRTLTAHKNWLQKLSCHVVDINKDITNTERLDSIVNVMEKRTALKLKNKTTHV